MVSVICYEVQAGAYDRITNDLQNIDDMETKIITDGAHLWYIYIYIDTHTFETAQSLHL